MIEMTLALAQRIAAAAHAKSKDFNRPVSVCIVDEAGRMVYFSRADGAGFYTFDTSRAKAMTAASFRRTTAEITEHHDQNPLLWYSISGAIPGGALPSPGGRPVFKDGHCIGAIGIGGGTPKEDDACCAAGQAVMEG